MILDPASTKHTKMVLPSPKQAPITAVFLDLNYAKIMNESPLESVPSAE